MTAIGLHEGAGTALAPARDQALFAHVNAPFLARVQARRSGLVKRTGWVPGASFTTDVHDAGAGGLWGMSSNRAQPAG